MRTVRVGVLTKLNGSLEVVIVVENPKEYLDREKRDRLVQLFSFN